MDLHTLALNGDTSGIISLLRSEPKVVNHRAYGRTALHHACHQGHYDAARALLICGADPNYPDANNSETPLHVACTNGHTKIVVLLCNRGAKVNHPDGHYRWAALHHSSERGDTETVHALLTLETPCSDGHVIIDLQDIDGFTPLHHACINGFPDVASMLLEYGANPHAQAHNGWSVMHCACRRGLQDFCISLIQQGIHMNVKDNKQRTALDIAHTTRIDVAKLTNISVAYWRNMRRQEKEHKDIAEGKNLYIKPAKIADNKAKHKKRTSVWAEEFDLSSQPVEDIGDAALAMIAMKNNIGNAAKR